jgi:hypothetical protein
MESHSHAHTYTDCMSHMLQDCYNVIGVQEALRVANRIRILMHTLIHTYTYQDCYNVIDVQEALRVANGITLICTYSYTYSYTHTHIFQDCYNVNDVQEALRVANGINAISNLINPERFIAMSTSAVAQAGVAALKESQLLSCQVYIYVLCVRETVFVCAHACACYL